MLYESILLVNAIIPLFFVFKYKCFSSKNLVNAHLMITAYSIEIFRRIFLIILVNFCKNDHAFFFSTVGEKMRAISLFLLIMEMCYVVSFFIGAIFSKNDYKPPLKLLVSLVQMILFISPCLFVTLYSFKGASSAETMEITEKLLSMWQIAAFLQFPEIEAVDNLLEIVFNFHLVVLIISFLILLFRKRNTQILIYCFFVILCAFFTILESFGFVYLDILKVFPNLNVKIINSIVWIGLGISSALAIKVVTERGSE
jgi:hypothetical protein